MQSNPLFGLILAGGKSRRLGSDKALLLREGRSQLAHLADLLADCVDEVFVSTRADQGDESERGQFQQIVDRYTDIGPVAGILSALESRPDADWLVVACDLPNISSLTLQHLLDHRDGDQPFTAYISSYDGLPEPLCAVYHAGCGTIINQFVDDGIHCPRKILIRSETRLLEQLDPRSLDNVNTPDDLKNSILKVRQ